MAEMDFGTWNPKIIIKNSNTSTKHLGCELEQLEQVGV